MSQLSHRALNGTGGNITFEIDTFEEDEIKVYVDGVEKTNGGSNLHDYTIPDYATTGGTVTWNTTGSNTAPSNAFKIRIVRQTDVLNQGNTAVEGRATYQAGSSIRAADLNANTKQVLRALQEHNDQKIQTYDIDPDAVTTTEIKDETIVNANVSTSAAIAGTKVTPAFGSQNISTSGTAATGALTVTGNIAVSGTVDGRDVATDGSKLDGLESGATADQTSSDIKTLLASDNLTQDHLAADSVGNSELQTNAVGVNEIQNGAINNDKLANTSISNNKLQDDSVSTSRIINLNVTTDKIADDAVTPDKLQNTSVTPNSYGSSTSIPTFTVDAQGRITAASGNTVSFDVVADTSPQLGGNLDVQTREITTSGTNQDITLTPTGSGTVTVKGTGSASGTVEVNTETNAKSIKIQAPTNSNLAGNYTLTLPVNDGDNGQFLKTDGLGVLSWDTVSGGGGGGGTAAPNNIVTISESVDGSRTDFSMSVTPASAQNLIVSVNGVVQKPNAGTTIAGSAEGYCVDTATLKFATAPANGSSIFIIEHAATTASDRIVEGNSNVDIFDDNSTSRAVVNLDGAEKFRINEGGQIGLAGANYGTDGQVLTSQGSGAAAQWESIPSSDLVNDTTPQLGGDLDVQAKKITTSTTNGYIYLEPNGTGGTVFLGAGGNDAKIKLNCGQNSHGVTIQSPPHSAGANYTLTLPNTVNNGQFLTTDANGNLSFATVTTAAILDGAVTNDKIAGSTITSAKIANGTIVNADINSSAAIARTKLANVDVVDDTSPQLGGDLASNGNDILMGDNDEIKLGAGGDLKLEHQSSSGDSLITEVGSGNFIIQGSNIIIRDAGTAEKHIEMTQNGSVDLYHNGGKKFETTSGGVKVSGILTSSITSGQAVSLGDNVQIHLGTGDDLKIYHDGSHSYIQDSGTGDLTLIANKTVIGSSNNAETCASFEENASVKLYYDNNLRFETHANGSSLRSTSPSSAATHWSEGGFKPWANDTYDLGDASYRWRNLHCNDGILFKGNNTNATTLDDYEEGTWTPVLEGYTGTQWDSVTYDDNRDYTTGNYVKIGSLIFVYYYTGAFSLASGWNTAYARINGLPYAFRNNEPYYGGQFTFTHTNCFKNTSNDLFDCHSGYGVYSQTYINPSIGNSADTARWGSEGTRYIMVAGTYQTNV